jgi:2-polyprenyl-3-methyl-5-hydroxy-6-metoxy-1,4-benzoquinol methylase
VNKSFLEFKAIHTQKKRTFLHSEMLKVSNEIHENFDLDEKLSHCPCCGSKDIQYFTNKFGFQLDTCSSCNHIFTNPFPSSKALQFYYNSKFKEFENEFFLESFDNRVPIFTQRLDLMSDLGCGRKVLDVGTAVGIFISANESSGERFQITACDISLDACNHIKKTYPTVRVLNEDIQDLPPNSFDVVTLWDTIEHIPHPKDLLASIKNQLTKAGYFLFSTPNTKSFEWEVMNTDHVQLLPPGHVNLYNKENITSLLKNQGFIVKDIVTMNPSLDLTYIRNEIEKESESVSKKAAISLLDLIFKEDTFDSMQNSMRKNRMGGNMVVVAKKND